MDFLSPSLAGLSLMENISETGINHSVVRDFDDSTVHLVTGFHKI